MPDVRSGGLILVVSYRREPDTMALRGYNQPTNTRLAPERLLVAITMPTASVSDAVVNLIIAFPPERSARKQRVSGPSLLLPLALRLARQDS